MANIYWSYTEQKLVTSLYSGVEVTDFTSNGGLNWKIRQPGGVDKNSYLAIDSDGTNFMVGQNSGRLYIGVRT